MRVLFVCLGNICRSPTAHGVFRKMVRTAALTDQVQVHSGGTGDWHVGEPPDHRAQHHARRRGYDLGDLRARQVVASDIVAADIVLAMDRANLEALRLICPAAEVEKIQLFLNFAPAQPEREVPDPYNGGDAGFEHVLDLVEEASRGLLAHVVAQTARPG